MHLSCVILVVTSRCCLDTDHTQLESGSIKVHQTEMRDSGIYICVATNNAGTALGQVRLEVQGEIKVTKGLLLE